MEVAVAGGGGAPSRPQRRAVVALLRGEREQGENDLLKRAGWSAAMDSGPAAGGFSGELSPAEVRSSIRASLPGRAKSPFSVSSGQCAVGKTGVPNNFFAKYLGWKLLR
jgi:hypothetical protein